ncbi:hypothetical protein ACK34J_05470 [Aeromonas veronii]
MNLLKRRQMSSAHRMKQSGILLLALSLAGCGGGDEGGSGSNDSPLPPSPVTQVQVVDGFSVAKPNERTRLDLSSFVRGRGATLASFTSDQPGCGAGSITGLTAEVNISETTLCEYRFSARSGVSQGSATLSVLATRAATPLLEPISATMTVVDGAQTYDLPSLYGVNWPTGYQLKLNSAVVQGGTAQGHADSGTANRITYTPPGGADWNRVLFTLENGVDGEEILGTLYVTISASLNQAPTISNNQYDYSAAANANPAIVMFDKVTIDLANLKDLNIVDPDGGEWQLIDVQSFTASVYSADPFSVANKRFFFEAGTVGEHIVSYIVGDRDGGYQMGLMKIDVGAKEQAKDWANIDLVTPGLRFYAPPLFSELKSGVSPEFVIEPVWDVAANGGTGNTIGAVGNLAATAYCSGKRLPKQADLDTLRSATGTPATELAKYPKVRPYLISDVAGTTFQTYNLTDGSVAPYVAGTTPNPYVVCIGDYSLSYNATPNTPYAGMTNTVVSDGTWQTIGTVNSGGGTTADSPTLFGTPTNAGPGSLGVGNFRLTPGSCTGGTCTLDAKGASDEYGTATAQIANAVMTSNTFNVPTTFLQNAQVTAASATTNNAKADGSAANVITLTLKDRAGNPVPNGTPVKLSYSTSTVPAFTPTITPASGASVNVNASGQVAINIKSGTVGTVTLTNPVVVGGLPLTATSTTVTFVTPNAAPVASALTWSTPITASVGEPFIINWTYTDAENNPQSGSTVEWFLNGVTTGTATTTLKAGKFIYYPVAADANKTLTAKITPKASAGTLVGAPVTSAGITVAPKGSLSGFVSPPNSNYGTWSDANSYCNGLNVNGYTGYRLPTINELQGVWARVTGGVVNYHMCDVGRWPLGPGICGDGTNVYWTSEIHNVSAHKTVNIQTGNADYQNDTPYSFGIVCIR